MVWKRIQVTLGTVALSLQWLDCEKIFGEKILSELLKMAGVKRGRID